MEAGAGNDYWSTSGTCNCSVGSSTWSDLSGATAYISADKAGPIVAWGLAELTTSFCNHDVRLRIVSSDGSWEEESVSMPAVTGYYSSGALASTFGQFEIPAVGDYILSLQYTGQGSGGSCYIGNYAVSAFQLAVAP